MVVEIVELFPNRLGEPEWFITDKIPLHYQTGEGQVSVGWCGVLRRARSAQAARSRTASGSDDCCRVKA